MILFNSNKNAHGFNLGHTFKQEKRTGIPINRQYIFIFLEIQVKPEIIPKIRFNNSYGTLGGNFKLSISRTVFSNSIRSVLSLSET
ncbi:hypothetical protein D1609_03460 [Leptospira borgpetersenii serovar Hardjo-bovis]|nr:hypothetical protein D1609_03460 [Leptospira borgpetersenii serovar Hardjo-bovis]TQE52857.1 hypothetical protein FFZ95_09410 [Leptospira borgpetersenii]TQE56030.1 hypothetical protein FFZ96_11225 [Leptospira borgpetersenii]